MHTHYARAVGSNPALLTMKILLMSEEVYNRKPPHKNPLKNKPENLSLASAKLEIK